MQSVVLVGEPDAFLGGSGKRASFLSHIACEDVDMSSSNVDDVIEALRSCNKTVVAAVCGNVSGGSGLEVIMACDYRVVLSTCELGGEADLSETFLSQRTLHANRRRAKKESPMTKLLNGESIPAQEARHIGLVDEVIASTEEDLLIRVGSQVARNHGKRVHYARAGKSLLYYIPEQFLILRSSQLFNLIRDFPDSQGALDELKTALKLTCQFDFVISSIKSQLAERLLIPGAHTEDVLEMYLRTFKVVSFLFPDRSMEVFVRIATPVIHHLQRRPDSVKCIVAAMLDQDRDSVETDSETSGDDTMSLLIGVYGGQESFLAEYKDMLAGRLISIGSFDIDRELASLDLMKSKFGEAALGNCSVMIKDVMESRRLNAKIKTQLATFSLPKQSISLNLTMMVKSGHFWPTASSATPEGDDDFSSPHLGLESFAFLPAETVTLMREYERIFTQLKPTQRVEWRKGEGLMTISIAQKNGRESEFRLTPIYVEVLSLFEKISLPSSAILPSPPVNLTLEAIATAVKLSVEKVRPVVQFWVARGILREIEINKFALNE